MRPAWKILGLVIVMLVGIILIGKDVLPTSDKTERVRAYTRTIEFDFVDWTLRALLIKNQSAALNLPQYMADVQQSHLVEQYLALVDGMDRTRATITRFYSDPAVKDAESASASMRDSLAKLQLRRDKISPLVEQILQNQESEALAQLGLTLGGQPLPPVEYHITDLPNALIVSPREKIQQDASIQISADLKPDQVVALEKSVEKGLNVSALVEPIGGLAAYPTMVMSTSDVAWLTEVVGHEWTHNYLTLRPLGMSYEVSEVLRTMNETTAAISGKEISLVVLKNHYPKNVPEPEPAVSPQAAKPSQPAIPASPSVFDFRKEMHITRVQADALLLAGKIQEAEAYMEARRQVFWQVGYHSLRRINQAYFAFNGAYNDQPGGGASGDDPVGPAVQALRARSRSLAAFINRIAWITNLTTLQRIAAGN